MSNEILFSIGFMAIALYAWNLHGKNDYKILTVLYGLIGLIVLTGLDQTMVSGNSWTFLATTGGMLVLHFFIGKFWSTKGNYYPALLVLVSSVALYILGKEQIQFNLGGAEAFGISFQSPAILALPFLGALIEPIAESLEKVLGNFFKIDYKNRRGISRSFYFLLLAMMLLTAHFMGSFVGVALLATGYTATLFYHQRSAALWNMALALWAITSIFLFLNLGEIATANLVSGKIMFGLFSAGFIALLSNTIQRARNNKKTATFITWAIALIVPSLIILMGTQLSQLGGPDAYIGLIIGFTLAAVYGINTRNNLSLLGIYLSIGLLAFSMLNRDYDTEENTTSQNIETKEKMSFEEAVNIESGAESMMKIDSENSEIRFVLGPEGGQTNGKISGVSGSFDFSAGLDQLKINVELDVTSLSTFSSVRDEHLMTEDYFNADKFPKMKFVSSLVSLNDGAYSASGKMTMMGKTDTVVLSIKHLGDKDGKGNVWMGMGQLDRTKFGMTPDSKEGNLVDFEFEVTLQ
jgi:polyisoprenoid-binding protein YceI